MILFIERISLLQDIQDQGKSNTEEFGVSGGRDEESCEHHLQMGKAPKIEPDVLVRLALDKNRPVDNFQRTGPKEVSSLLKLHMQPKHTSVYI